jgi:hypothetical protein
LIIIEDFVNVETNTTFVEESYKNLTFLCKKNASRLICVTPIISIMPLYTAHPLRFTTGQNVATPYILYGKLYFHSIL